MSSPCLQEGNVVRMLMFANGGGCAPPNPPAVLKPSMSAIKRKHHVITMFAMRESCAKHFGHMGSCASPVSQRSKSSKCCYLQHLSVPSPANGVITLHHLKRSKTSKWCNWQHLRRSKSSKCWYLHHLKLRCHPHRRLHRRHRHPYCHPYFRRYHY